MAPWTPGMPWPSGTAGGAAAPSWGGYVRLLVRAGLAPGRTFHMGAHNLDRLDAGNVLGGGAIGPSAAATAADRLWVDMSCDITEVEIGGGSTSSQGIFAKADASTLTATLADPTAKYDPLNTGGPFSYGGRSRLVPGVPVEAFAEVVDGPTGTWQRFPIFTGTADSWGEDWTPNPRERVARLIATDATKTWARYDRPEQPPAGAGDTVAARINRIVTFFGWPGVVEAPPGGSSRTLQATTLAQPGWELLNRTVDDELGAIYLTADGHLRWLNRETWSTANLPPPVLALGCATLPPPTPPLAIPVHDVLIDATPTNLDLQMRNDVNASRAGGTMQHVANASSVETYGAYQFQRTDLGLADDTQVAGWATRVVELYAYPQVGLDDVTLVPAADPASWDVWEAVLALDLFTDLVRIRWAPPDLPDHLVDGLVRVVGFDHRINRGHWEVTWQLLATRSLSISGSIFTMGAHANDRLDTNYVMG
jgi:hypothetical protein